MNDRRTVTSKQPGYVEVEVRKASAQELLARTVMVIGSACLAVGGVIGFSMGFIEGRRKEDDRHEV